MGTKPAKVGHLAATLLKYVKKQKNKMGYPIWGSKPGLSGVLWGLSGCLALYTTPIIALKLLKRGL